jgi:hypothetical protein
MRCVVHILYGEVSLRQLAAKDDVAGAENESAPLVELLKMLIVSVLFWPQRQMC